MARFKSKSKSSSIAPTVEISRLVLGIFTSPNSPLTVPEGLGISLILNSDWLLTLCPSGSVPDAEIVTDLPVPGFIAYLLPLVLDNPGADALTLLSGIPGIEIVIGFDTPRYTTFILSAEITAALGLDIVAKVCFTSTGISSPSWLNINFPSITWSPGAPALMLSLTLPSSIE